MWGGWNCQDTADGINPFGSRPGGRKDNVDPFDGDGSGNRHGEYFDESGFSSFHPGGVHFVMCDGSVQFLSDDTDKKLLCQQTTRAGADIEGGDCTRKPPVGPPRR
jgi:prepilin-type processing-associated H-X9-DG protein